MRPCMSSSTCEARVGLGRPLRLALGAAIGQPLRRISSCATGWLGKRMPTVESPADTTSGMQARFGRISVIGPGQNASISRHAASGTSVTSAPSWSKEAMCTISGLSAGRPFASKMRCTACALSASAPSPYTVSVGKATTSPARMYAAACATDCASAFTICVSTFFLLSIRSARPRCPARPPTSDTGTSPRTTPAPLRAG